MSDDFQSPNAEPLSRNAITDEDREHLESLLESVEQLSDIVCEHATPYPGTELALDAGLGCATSTWESAAVAGQSALDHLHYFASTTLMSGRLTTFASFTAVRSAVTSAALVMWLLPKDQPERLTRALNLAWQEASNERSAAHKYLVAEPPGADKRLRARIADAKRVVAKNDATLKQIEQDADRLGIDLVDVKNKPSDQKLIKIAAKSIQAAEWYSDFGTEKEALATWQFLSAHAHGLSWAATTTSEEVYCAVDGGVRTVWRPDFDLAMQGVRIAWDLLYAAFKRYDELGRRYAVPIKDVPSN